MNAELRGFRQLATRLHGVRGELEKNLLDARQGIEQHAESPHDLSGLDQARAKLHEAAGVATLVGAHGLALLIEEIGRTTQALRAGTPDEPQPAYAALLAACMQASDYLDALSAGQDDCVLVLQPAINELRLVRGGSLLTEDDLLVAQFRLLGLRLPMPERLGLDVDSRTEAARLAPLFTAALLSWIRDRDSAQSLSRIGRIAEMLAAAAQEPTLYPLWCVLAAAIEALLLRGLEASSEIKRQVGRTGQLLRELAESGEAVAADRLDDIALRLLVCVARSRSSGARVTALREQLALSVWLPSEPAIQARRARLRGPSTGLLQRAAAEVRADLTEVKERIDQALRAGATAPDYEDSCKRLRQVADTLQVLGLGEQSLALEAPLESLREADAPQPASPAAWMEMARAVLEVELSLDGALYRQLQAGAATRIAAIANRSASADLRDGTAALLRESLVDLASVSSAVEVCLRSDADDGLDGAEQQLDQIAAGLRMLGDERAAELIQSVSAHLGPADFARLRTSRAAAADFADSLAAIERYLDVLRDGLPDADTALDDLAQRVGRLPAPLAQAPQPEEHCDVVFVADPALDQDARAAAIASTDSGARVPPMIRLEDVDPQLREVFLNEAREVVETLRQTLSPWLRQVQDRALQVKLRRAFHTLKGSGRTVRARAIGEFAFALESVLNRCLDDALDVSPAVIDVVRQAVAVMPGLIEAYRMRLAPPASAASLALSASLLASGRTHGDLRELLGVFRKDAGAQLQAVERWVAERDRGAWDHALPELVVRSFHTVRGAALTLGAGVPGAGAIGELAGSLETWLEMLRQSGLSLSPAGLGLIDGAARAMSGWIEPLGQPGGGAIDVQPWLVRVEALRSGFADAPGARAEPDRQQAEVFAFAALDLVQTLEAELSLWSRNPAAREHARSLRANIQQLDSAAASARCEPIQAAAQALNQRLAGIDDDAAPERGFFAEIKPIVEGLYAQLDAYRAGSVAAAEPIAPVQEPLDLPAAGSAPAPEILSAQTPAAADRVDPDLLAVFLHEAEELLDEIEWHVHLIADDPREAEVLGSWQRALHTLKGSARVAAMPGIAEVAHRLESMTEQVRTQAQHPADSALFALRLRIAVDGLHGLLDEARDGSSGDADVVLGRIDSARIAEPRPFSEPARAPDPDEVSTAAGVDDRASDTEENGRHARESGHPVFARNPATIAAERLDSRFRGNDDGELIGDPPLTGRVATAPTDLAQSEAAIAAGWNPELFWRPETEDAAAIALHRETARVPVERLDALLNQAGEIAICCVRLEENRAALGQSLGEMAQTLARLREQLRGMDIETEARIAARGPALPDAAAAHRYDAEFDALEMDRYSRMQELSRALAESLSDLSALHVALDGGAAEAEGLLQQQGRVNQQMQQALIGTLRVPFSRQVERLSRVVRQTAEQNAKLARAEFSGADIEIDRNVLERMSAPLEHLLRNAVVHGIEEPAARVASGKDREGLVQLGLKRDGGELLIDVSDDGGGLDHAAIRDQAVRRGLVRADARLSDEDLTRYVFAPGFSTAPTLTQHAGRGIGLDVVLSQIKQLGGSIKLHSAAGRGTGFSIRLPLNLAVAQALLVQVGEERYALPLGAVEGITRVPRESLDAMLGDATPLLSHDGKDYRLQYLSDLLGQHAPLGADARAVPAILVRTGAAFGDSADAAGGRVAVLVDKLIGNREIVSKAAGPILGAVAGVSGATLMADGRVVLILDLPALIQMAPRRMPGADSASGPREAAQRLIMVVDDSITIRRVSERLLLRHGYRVIAARDGLDAIAQLQTESPDAILLDIEMPRADGFDVAAFVRNTSRIAATPIVMITSRSGDKHRERARQLGVDRYLVKPFQEDQLLAQLEELVGPMEQAA